VIVLHHLTKVDGHLSRVDRDKYPEHSWIICNIIGDFDLPPRAGFGAVFPCFIPMHIGVQTQDQFGYRYAETACKERSELYGDFGTK